MISLLLKIFNGVFSFMIVSIWGVSLWRYKKKDEQIFKYPTLSLSYVLLVIGIIDCVINALEFLFLIIGGVFR